MQSILARELIKPLLRVAKRNLEVDGHLESILVVRLTSGERLVVPLHLPSASEDKRRVLSSLRQSWERMGEKVEEALLLSESWLVNAQKSPGALSLAPSQHPQRIEAITFVGRDARSTRFTFVVQPFTRTAHGQVVFEEVEFALYNKPADHGHAASGILDDLFAVE